MTTEEFSQSAKRGNTIESGGNNVEAEEKTPPSPVSMFVEAVKCVAVVR
jgi:hypothetical protein